VLIIVCIVRARMHVIDYYSYESTLLLVVILLASRSVRLVIRAARIVCIRLVLYIYGGYNIKYVLRVV
jgi:hypothetical protein